MIRGVASAYRAAFAGLPRTVWILAAAALVNRSGTMVLPFLTLYLTREIGLSTTEAGGILALFGMGSIAGSFIGGWLSDRIGPVRVQIWSLLATGVGFLVLTALHAPAAIAVTVLITSVAGEGFRPALMASVALASPVETRTRSFSLLRLAVNLGMSIGPAVGGFLAVRHYALLFVVDAVTCWLAAGVLWAVLPGSASRLHEGRASSGAGVSPWRDGPFLGLLVLAFLLALAFFQIMATLPLYFRQHYGFAEDTIGMLLALNALVIAAVEMVLMHAIDHLEPLRVAGIGGFLVCLGFALMPLGSGVAFAAITVLVWTAGEMLSLPLLNSAAAHRATPGSTGSYLGAYTLSFSAALVVAPAVGTAVYERLGPQVLWFSVGGLGILLWVGFWALLGRFRRGNEAGDA